MFPLNFSEIEDAVRNLQAEKQKPVSQETEEQRVGLGAEGHYDTDIYGGSRYEGGYVTSIASKDDDDVSLHVNYFMPFQMCIG